MPASVLIRSSGWAPGGCCFCSGCGPLFRFYARVAKSNFPFVDCAISPLGLPLFVALLYRSWFKHEVSEAGKLEGKNLPWMNRDLA